MAIKSPFTSQSCKNLLAGKAQRRRSDTHLGLCYSEQHQRHVSRMHKNKTTYLRVDAGGFGGGGGEVVGRRGRETAEDSVGTAN